MFPSWSASSKTTKFKFLMHLVAIITIQSQFYFWALSRTFQKNDSKLSVQRRPALNKKMLNFIEKSPKVIAYRNDVSPVWAPFHTFFNHFVEEKQRYKICQNPSGSSNNHWITATGMKKCDIFLSPETSTPRQFFTDKIRFVYWKMRCK